MIWRWISLGTDLSFLTSWFLFFFLLVSELRSVVQGGWEEEGGNILCVSIAPAVSGLSPQVWPQELL